MPELDLEALERLCEGKQIGDIVRRVGSAKGGLDAALDVIDALCDLVRKQREELETTALIPYTCPVCGGRGTVQHGFYDQNASASSTSREICCSCQATGIIWSLPGKEVSHDTKRG